jgi:glutathione S-transferase
MKDRKAKKHKQGGAAVKHAAIITLHGAAASRASRSLLALEELGLPYKHAPLKPWSDAADAEALARINPNARVPVLDDDGLILWESIAVNLYLADRYGTARFWPQHPRDRALVYQWSLWSQTEVDVRARHIARSSGDAALKRDAEAERLTALAILDRALVGRPYLLGDFFTLADLNLAATLSEPWENGRVDGELDPADHGLDALAAWLARCTGRASWERVRRLP